MMLNLVNSTLETKHYKLEKINNHLRPLSL
jgi:hypothetical protein